MKLGKPIGSSQNRYWAKDAHPSKEVVFRKGQRLLAAQQAYQQYIYAKNPGERGLKAKLEASIHAVRAFFSRTVSILPEVMTRPELAPLRAQLNKMQEKSLLDRNIMIGNVEHNELRSRGAARSMVRKAAVRIWPMSGISHMGHVGVSFTNILDPENKKHEYLGWWPGDGVTTSDKTSYIREQTPSMVDSYGYDQLQETNKKSMELLEERFFAEAKQSDGAELTDKQREILKTDLYIPRLNQQRVSSSGKWKTRPQSVYLPLAGNNAHSRGKWDRTVLFGLDENALKSEIEKIRDQAEQGKRKYRAVSVHDNCSGVGLDILMAGGAALYVEPDAPILYEDPNHVYDYMSRVQAEVDTLNDMHQRLRNGYLKADKEYTQWQGRNMTEMSLEQLAATFKIINISKDKRWEEVESAISELNRISTEPNHDPLTLKELTPINRKLVTELTNIMNEGKIFGKDEAAESQKLAMSLAIAILEKSGELVASVTTGSTLQR